MSGEEARVPSGYGLFSRLPHGLFSPLASPGREWYWKFILEVYDRRFGPDAIDGAVDGVLRKYVTQDAENFLLNHQDWMMDGGEASSPVSVRASQLVERLIDSGWLQIEKRGTKVYLLMHYSVSAFLSLMIQFADEGPTVVAGQVQSIHNNLAAVKIDPSGQAAAFNTAARDAVKLIGYLNAMTMRVSEVMTQISNSEHLSVYLREFFSNYISRLYIADYGDLRTKNHPLRNRRNILDIVSDLGETQSSRDSLVAWYAKTFTRGNAEEAVRLFDRDVRRFERFIDIDRYLDRLDESITKAISQSVSYIDYRVRNQGRIDTVIEQLVEAATDVDASGEPLSFTLGQGELFGEHMLRDSPEFKPIRVRSLLAEEKESPREMAIVLLTRLKNMSRQIDPKRLNAYCADLMLRGGSSDVANIKSVADYTDHIAILAYGAADTAMRAVESERGPYGDFADMTVPRAKLRNSAIGKVLKDYEVIVDEDDRVDSELMDAPRFVLRRKKEAT